MHVLNVIDREFFLSDQLAACFPEARLLYLGLLLMADENGMVQNRPKRLKAELLPYETQVDVYELLTQLAHSGLLERVHRDDTAYILVNPLNRMYQTVAPTEWRRTVLGMARNIVRDLVDDPQAIARKIDRAEVSAAKLDSQNADETEPSATGPVDSCGAGPEPKEEEHPEPEASLTDVEPVYEEQCSRRGGKRQVDEWLTAERQRQIRHWVALGCSLSEIARRMERPYATVFTWFKKYPEFKELFDPAAAPPGCDEEPLTAGEHGEPPAGPEKPIPEEDASTSLEAERESTRGMVPEESEPKIQREQTVTVLPAAGYAPPPERKQPGFGEWVDDPNKAEQVRSWVAQGLKMGQIAARMGVPLNTLLQWKVMSVEFAALFVKPRKAK